MYRISQLAKRSGLSRSTLIYYEKQGLIKGQRSSNGYRFYSEADAQRLFLIQQLQSGRLTLHEIKACLTSKLDRQMLEHRLAVLDEEIQQKQKARQLLASLLGKDDKALRGWHEQLESSAPEPHFQWLLQQGFSEKDALRLRWLAKNYVEHDNFMNDFEKFSMAWKGLDQVLMRIR